jgi:hypothetical protein
LANSNNLESFSSHLSPLLGLKKGKGMLKACFSKYLLTLFHTKGENYFYVAFKVHHPLFPLKIQLFVSRLRLRSLLQFLRFKVNWLIGMAAGLAEFREIDARR